MTLINPMHCILDWSFLKFKTDLWRSHHHISLNGSNMCRKKFQNSFWRLKSDECPLRWVNIFIESQWNGNFSKQFDGRHDLLAPLSFPCLRKKLWPAEPLKESISNFCSAYLLLLYTLNSLVLSRRLLCIYKFLWQFLGFVVYFFPYLLLNDWTQIFVKVNEKIYDSTLETVPNKAFFWVK